MNKKHPYSATGQPEQPGGTYTPKDNLHTLADLTNHGDLEDLDFRGAANLRNTHPDLAEAVKKVVIPMEGLTDAELKMQAEERICPYCTVKQAADDMRLRAIADLDNTRKRLQREKEEHVAYAAEAVLSDILPALDNLELALQHAAAVDACKNLVVGVEMTKKMLLDSLKRHGLETVGCIGEEFDPAMHDAVNTEAHPEVPTNCISQLLSRGYTLKGRLLRPARVVVSKK